MRLRIPTLFACATLALAACSGDGTGPHGLDRGEFRGTVSGSLSASLEGDAKSGDARGLGADRQDQMVLEDVAQGVTIVIGHHGTSFTEGRETLMHFGEGEGPFVLVFFEDERRAFISTAGSGFIDLDEITSRGITGTLEFTAREADFNGGRPDGEVRVSLAIRSKYEPNCCGR